MLRRIISTALLLFSLSPLFSQYPSDSIQIKKTLFGTTFRQYGKVLTGRQLLNITRSNHEAYKEMKMARQNYVFGSIFGMPGGFCVGWPLGAAAVGGEPNMSMLAVGLGLTVVSIPFSVGYMKHAKASVRIYNAGLKTVNTETKKAPDFLAGDPKPLPLPAGDLASGLFFIPSDSSYQGYRNRLESLLKQDRKVISYEFREYKYGNDKIKSRGYKAKHKYGVNEEYSYTIGTWEYYTKEGKPKDEVNYNLKGEIVK